MTTINKGDQVLSPIGYATVDDTKNGKYKVVTDDFSTAIFEAKDLVFVYAAEDGYDDDSWYPTEQDISGFPGIPHTFCYHVWEHYVGFTREYDYCIKCGQKQGDE